MKQKLNKTEKMLLWACYTIACYLRIAVAVLFFYVVLSLMKGKIIFPDLEIICIIGGIVILYTFARINFILKSLKKETSQIALIQITNRF